VKLQGITVKVLPPDSGYQEAVGEPIACAWFDQQFHWMCGFVAEIELDFWYGRDFPNPSIRLCRKHIGHIQQDVQAAMDLLDARDAYSGGMA
jgi:hypothetical protein